MLACSNLDTIPYFETKKNRLTSISLFYEFLVMLRNIRNDPVTNHSLFQNYPVVFRQITKNYYTVMLSRVCERSCGVQSLPRSQNGACGLLKGGFTVVEARWTLACWGRGEEKQRQVESSCDSVDAISSERPRTLARRSRNK